MGNDSPRGDPARAVDEEAADAACTVAAWAGLSSMDAARAVLVGLYIIHEKRPKTTLRAPSIWDVEAAMNWANGVITHVEEIQRRPK